TGPNGAQAGFFDRSPTRPPITSRQSQRFSSRQRSSRNFDSDPQAHEHMTSAYSTTSTRAACPMVPLLAVRPCFPIIMAILNPCPYRVYLRLHGWASAAGACTHPTGEGPQPGQIRPGRGSAPAACLQQRCAYRKNGGVSNVDIDGNNTLQIKCIGAAI